MPVFLGGVAAGLVLASVTFLAVGTVRRMRARRTCDRPSFIDGVRPPKHVELDLRPAEEANAAVRPRLESEMPEFSELSQRW